MTDIQRQRDTDPTRKSAGGKVPGLWRIVVGVGVALGALAALLFFFDPAQHAFYPVCLFKRLTGYDCPGCGGLRALHQLLHGDIWQAIQLNALVVVLMPGAAIWGWRALRKKNGAGGNDGKRVLLWAWLAVITLIAFGLFRNLPLWPFAVTPM